MSVGTGIETLVSDIASLLGPFSGWVRPSFFVGFFVLAAIAFRYRDRFRVRRTYVAFFLACLLVANVVGVQVLPIVTLHKFSYAGPTERTEYEIRMIDANGNELLYDARAVPPSPGSRLTVLAYHMVNRFGEEKRDEAARFLFRRARAHRNYVETEPLVRADRIEFPRHGLDFRWNRETVSGYGEFVGLRIYEIDVKFSDYGSDASKSETLVFEWVAENDTVRRAGVERGCPACS